MQFISDVQEKRALAISAVVGTTIVAISIAGLSFVYPRGIEQLFTEFISFSLLVPFVLGAILISLGLHLRIIGDGRQGYSVLLGTGAAIIIGFIVVVWTVMTIFD